MDNKIKFTKHQLKFLKDLRLVYDSFNQAFSENFYDEYVPIGIFIVHYVTFENYYKQDHCDYNALANLRHLEIAGELSKRIKESPNLIFHLNNSAYKDTTVRNQLIKLEKEQDDNFFGILVSKISYENLIKFITDTPHLSSKDKAIEVIEEIRDLVKSQLLNTFFTTPNKILYHSVKNKIQHNKQFQFHEVIANIRDLLMEGGTKKKKPTAQEVWNKIVKLFNEDKNDPFLKGLMTKYNRDDNIITWISNNYATETIKRTSFDTIYSNINKKYPLN